MFNKNVICKKIAGVFMVIVVCSGFITYTAWAEAPEVTADDPEWASFCSNYFVIYCRPDANLNGIDRELRTKAFEFGQPVRYGEVSVSDEICYRMDQLFNRVKEMLNMYPKIPRVNIRIFKDRSELNEEYFKLFSRREDLKSYYVKDYNTIYTSESDIDDSIIIHEMAHAIIDHYFSVTPPETVGEILAAYVDAHLEG